MDRSELVRLFLVCDETDCQTLCSKSPSTTNTMNVNVAALTLWFTSLGLCLWEIVVDDNVHSLDIDTTTKEVSRDEDSLLEIFELIVFGDALSLLHL